MKAVLYREYGSPDVLQLKEIPRPVAGKRDVLVKVHAITVTVGDSRMWEFRVPAMQWLPAGSWRDCAICLRMVSLNRSSTVPAR